MTVPTSTASPRTPLLARLGAPYGDARDATPGLFGVVGGLSFDAWPLAVLGVYLLAATAGVFMTRPVLWSSAVLGGAATYSFAVGQLSEAVIAVLAALVIAAVYDHFDPLNPQEA